MEDMCNSVSIVYEADGTRYEILVTTIENPESDYYKQYLISLINFGECYFDSDLRFIKHAILNKSKTLSGIDIQNINNALASRFNYIEKVKYDDKSKTFITIKQ